MRTICDFSWFQNTYTLEKFKLLNLDGAIFRAGCSTNFDSTAHEFAEFANECKVPFGLYWYFYPGVNLQKQCDLFIQSIKAFPELKNAWIDVEEHTGTASQLDLFYKTVYQTIKKSYPKVGIYSAAWVMDTYIPNMYKWMQGVPYWNAHYCKYYLWFQDYIKSLGGSWKDDTKLIPISNLTGIMQFIYDNRKYEALPKGIKKSLMLQTITFLPFRELSVYERHLDYNICSDEDFVTMFGGTYIPPIEVPTSLYKVTALLGLRIRSTPGGTIVGSKSYGQTVEILEIVNGWGRMSNGWMSMNWLVKI